MPDESPTPPPIDPIAFLRTLEGSLEQISRRHAIAFAAVLAERGLARAGGDDEYYAAPSRVTVRDVMNAIWDHACGVAPITAERFQVFDEALSEMGVLVDPDRYAATREYNGLGLVRQALYACGDERPTTAASDAAHAALHMAAHSLFADDYENDRNLRESWLNADVQTELARQHRLAEEIRGLAAITRADVERMRAEFGAR
jgi:hypothetical protein